MRRARIAAVIAVNQLHRISLDRSHLLWMVALPLALVLVLGASLTPLMGGAFEPTQPFEVAVTAGDAAAGQAVATALGRAPEHLRVTTQQVADDARRRVLQRQGDVAVIVPDDFPAAPMTLVGAPGHVAVEVVAAVIREVMAADEALLGAAFGAAPVPLTVTTVADDVPADAPAGAGEAWRQADAYGYYAVGMAVFFALITAHAGLMEHAADGRGGIAARTRAMGVGRGTRMLGGVLGSVAFVAAVLGALALGSWGLFGVGWGDPVAWLALTAVGSIAFVAVNLLVLAAVPQPAAFESIGTVVNMGMGMLGGSLTPLAVFPEALSSRFTWLPNRALLDGYLALSAGGGWSDLAGPFARMALAAVVAFALAAIVAMARAAREDR